MSRGVRQRQVADELGLSVAAVSRALSGDSGISSATRRQVRETCRRLGYRRIRRGGAAQLALVAVQRQASLQGAWDQIPALALARTAADHGTSMTVRLVQEPEDDAILEALVELSDRYDGLILYGFVSAAVLQGLGEQKIRFVMLGPPEGGIGRLPAGCVAVTADLVEAGRLATARLLARGHTRIVFLCPEHPPGLYFDSWLAGYRLAHHQAGLACDPELVFVQSERKLAAGSESLATSVLAASSRMSHPPTAWVLPNLLDFLGLLILAPKNGLALGPDMLTLGGRRLESLVAFLDGWPLVGEDIEAMLDAACSMLGLLIAGRPCPAGEIKVPLTVWHL